MPRVTLYKSSFTAGEIAPELAGRHDLRAYENGAGKLRNVFIHPTGGLSRRWGLRYVDTARGPGRLVAFEFNTEQVYLLVFTDHHLDIYEQHRLVGDLSTPWSYQDLRQINWTQNADTLLIVHPDFAPRKLTRTAQQAWELSEWRMFTKNGRVFTPHHKFATDNVTMQASGLAGTIIVVTSAPVFSPAHLGVRLRLINREMVITAVDSPTQVRADVIQGLPGHGPTTDWSEEAWSAARGWPVSVCFHQDRLVVGGSRDLPNRLWFSKSGDLFNFDLGEGLDDDSIEFSILSDQVNAIRHVFSGRHLQVFTSGAEWMVSGDPLTPTQIQLHRQTRVGSPVTRTIPPCDVDGATLFVSRTGRELREFLFTDTEQAYQANDLALLAHHLVAQPIEMDFHQSSRLFHIVMEDGSISTLTLYRQEEVTAWTRQETDGRFLSVSTVGDTTFLLVERRSGVFIEEFDSMLSVDAGSGASLPQPHQTWSGLAHLEGETVMTVADGEVVPDLIVVSGAIRLARPARRVEVGMPFTHVIEPLPPAASGGTAVGVRLRPIALTFRLWQTGALRLDTGRGPLDVSFRRLGSSRLDTPPPTFTGDRAIRVIGWRDSGLSPLWRIEQDAPLPFTLLSVSTEISIGA